MRGVIMENQEDKYVNINLNKVYEYKDLSDRISDRCDNCGSLKFKSSVGGGKFSPECTNCRRKKNIRM